MKKILLLLLCTQISFSLFAQTTNASFDYDGIERTYQYFLPPNYTAGNELPLVINLHGITSNAAQQSFYSGFTAVADTANFILCHPDGTDIVGGTGKQWNVNFPFSPNTTDDVGFINALIDTLHAQFDINLDKVYVTGMSNGGYMAYKLACELTDKITAIASVTGSMVPVEAMDCNPSSTIPVLQIHGTADPTVAYNGSDFGIPIEDLVAQWVAHNQCTTTPEIFAFPDIDTDDMCTVERIAYNDCDTDRKVHFYKIDGGEHTWPGAFLNIGVTNQDINASVEIWNFFNQYGIDIPASNKKVDFQSDDINISPNPFLDKVQIKANEAIINTVRITNTLGQLVYQKNNINHTESELQIGDLQTGVYIVILETSKGIYSETLVKQ